MNDPDYEMLGLGFILRASKSRLYREGVVRYHRKLLDFLQKHGLTTRELLKRGEVLDEDFKLMKSDLTEDGFALFKDGVDKWTRMVQNGLPLEDTSILENELEKIRSRLRSTPE